MKKLILFTLLFVLLLGTNISAQIYPDLGHRIGKVETDSIVVGTTAVQLTTHYAAWVQFMHENATARVWIGGSDVDSLNGFGALEQYDTTERYPVTDTKVFYIISNTAGTLVKFLWGSDGRSE